LSGFRGHTQTHHTRWDPSGHVISPSQRSDKTQHSQQNSMHPAGFEPATPACERSQTYALNSVATGIGNKSNCWVDPNTVSRFLTVSIQCTKLHCLVCIIISN